MLWRQTLTGISGVFSQLDRGGTADLMRETRIAQIIAMSFVILGAVVAGLMFNGS
jgi:hypothetical protein